MTTREQLEAEAAELYPDIEGSPENNFLVVNLRIAYVRAKTITAEQVEKAAWAIRCEVFGVRQGLPVEWPPWTDPQKYRNEAVVAFRAAGFRIEGDKT